MQHESKGKGTMTESEQCISFTAVATGQREQLLHVSELSQASVASLNSETPGDQYQTFPLEGSFIRQISQYMSIRA